MRASNEKDAIYWLAKMLHAGEDFRFIARRLVIFASEDVGLADAQALPLAIATQQAVEFVGMPEARIPLAHATVYMCRASKNREAYDSLGAATERSSKKRQARSRKVEKQTFSRKSRARRLKLSHKIAKLGQPLTYRRTVRRIRRRLFPIPTAS